MANCFPGNGWITSRTANRHQGIISKKKTENYLSDMKTNRERAGDRSSKKALVINQWPLLE